MLESARSAIQIRVVWPPRYDFQAGCHWKLGSYARREPSGEYEASCTRGSGTSVGNPPATGTVYICSGSATLPRGERNATRVPSGVQPSATSAPGW